MLDTTEMVCVEDKQIPYTCCRETEETRDQMCVECEAVTRFVCDEVEPSPRKIPTQTLHCTIRRSVSQWIHYDPTQFR